MAAGTRARQLLYKGASINNSRRRQNTLRQDKGGLVIEAATISAVDSTNSIDDSGSGLPTFVAGAPVEVIGMASNSRTYQVVTSSASSLVVLPDVVQDESAGATVIVRAV